MVSPKPPVAARHPVVLTLHGESRIDDYAWLRDPDWRAVLRDPARLDPQIRAYLEAENAYTEAVLAPYEGLRRALVAEMRGRIKEEDESVPQPDGPWCYFRRYRQGGQHPIFCRHRREAGPEAAEILLDGDVEADGKAFFRIYDCAHSPDHRHIVYGVDDTGSEIYTLKVREAAGRELDIAIAGGNGNVVWANDGVTLVYTQLDDNHRPSSVWRRRIDRPDEPASLIYRESDPRFFVSVGLTASRRFIVIESHQRQTSEAWLIDADEPAAPPRLVARREPGIEYDVEHHGDALLIRTNADGAEDFKVVTAPLAAPERANWRDLVPHRPGCLIRRMAVFAGHLVRQEMAAALPRLVIRAIPGGEEHAIAFAEEAYDLGILDGYEFDTTRLRFVYSSMATPQQVFDYDMASRTRTLRKTQEVPSGHDPAAYATRRLTAQAPDGTEIPISLLHRKTTPIDGSAPLLLYGYGAYGISIPAAFSTNRLSLVDRGFVYAIAHVRGGMEGGYRWYREGRLEHKTNSFTDYIACAERLIEAGYTRAGRIVGHGGSAGGLLMGAVANMRPALFAAICAEVPFVDVLNTMCDDSLPLTPPEWLEWGNPVEDVEAYRRIRGYSPYDNVTAQAYPAMLVSAGLTDPRVTYWEPAKWVAKLRATKTDDNLLLLKTEMSAGHAGAPGRFDKLDEVALVYLFALLATGLADAEARGHGGTER